MIKTLAIRWPSNQKFNALLSSDEQIISE